MSKLVIALAKKYNVCTNVLFMMKSDDFRLTDSAFSDNYIVITNGKKTRTTGVDSSGRKFNIFQGDNGVLYRVFGDWSALELEKPPTKTIHVCTNCGSANIQQDAWVHYNDRENVQTFDDLYCENCESSCKTREVTVPADFDVYSDIYKEGE